MNIFKVLAKDIESYGKKICQDKQIWQESNLEIPKDHLNGDISTNIAMIIASKEGTNPISTSLLSIK